ncbi:hypothetical protein [Schlesneria sp. DSM 10557]|uniref:hypothetical protein n=1 Tax=Schlesneria sp. DSM 10557 TaxID=3044399 RepID=UPI0035A087D4
MEPIYTSATVTPAYQLRWSLSLFAGQPLPASDLWLSELRQKVEEDGVRILEAQSRHGNTWQFFLSTRPEVAPPSIVKSVKGRLQHLVRETAPKAFRRNFLLAAIGNAKREVVESYVASQLDHHRMADDRVQSALQRFQLAFPEVDLSQRQTTAHGAYLYNMHLVLVHAGRWNEVREEALAGTRDMVLRIAHAKGHRISRLALLPDHLHLLAGFPATSSPEEIALGYLNNLAYAHGMRRIFSFSYYVGTVGEFDTGVIQAALDRS